MLSRIAELWDKALAKAKQAKGRLRLGEGFCCLGVLCDVYQADTGLGVWDAPNAGGWTAFHTGEGTYAGREVNFLPAVVRQWAGFGSNNGDYIDRTGAHPRSRSLTRDNDNGMTFDEIRKTIADHREEL